MRVVIQRVNKASVSIEEKTHSQIGIGLLILVGFEQEDVEEDLNWMALKITNLRIFSDNSGKMNLSIKEMDGEVLLVSQFTLYADTKKGNRPSFMRSEKPEKAKILYEKFITILEKSLSKSIKTGEFGADMRVELINDGPVTIIIDSKNKYF
jgi:D-tyrosyl-tRNA(Tyr) deacylase